MAGAKIDRARPHKLDPHSGTPVPWMMRCPIEIPSAADVKVASALANARIPKKALSSAPCKRDWRPRSTIAPTGAASVSWRLVLGLRRSGAGEGCAFSMPAESGWREDEVQDRGSIRFSDGKVGDERWRIQPNWEVVTAKTPSPLLSLALPQAYEEGLQQHAAL